MQNHKETIHAVQPAESGAIQGQKTHEQKNDDTLLVFSFLKHLGKWQQVCKIAKNHQYENSQTGLQGSFDIVKTQDTYSAKALHATSQGDPDFVTRAHFLFSGDTFAGQHLARIDLWQTQLMDPYTGDAIYSLRISFEHTTLEFDDDPKGTIQLKISEGYTPQKEFHQSHKDGLAYRDPSTLRYRSVAYKLFPGSKQFVAIRGEGIANPKEQIEEISDDHAQKLFDLIDSIFLTSSIEEIAQPERRGIQAPEKA